jgi:hypothetical protein
MKTLIVLGISAFAAVLLYAAAPWARGDDCYDIGHAVAAAESEGGGLLGLIDVPGAEADQLLVVKAHGTIQVMAFFHGCQVSNAVPLFPAAPPKPPPNPV